MPSIPFSKFVRIVSGVGAGAAVASRDLIGRILTDNVLTPADDGLEFTSAADVAAYYGSNSTEAAIALFYFSYVSPNISRPKKISFGRYSPSGSSARLIGGTGAKSLPQFQAITAGSLNLVVDGVAVPITGLDLSAASSLSAAATLIQTAVAATVPLASATVAYDAVSRRITLAASGLTTVRVELGTATPLSGLLQWDAPNGIVSPAVQPQSATDAFAATVDQSNNFGSFAFYPALTDLEDVIDVAQLAAGENVSFMFMVPVSRANAANWAAALEGIAGVALTLSPLPDEFPELFPMIQMAATNYRARNGVINYMFKQIGGLTPAVNTGAESDAMDALRINYYGLTKTAGQDYAFYQRGDLQGGPTAPIAMNVFANEVWLKDDAGVNLLALLLSSGRVPANETGRAQVLNAIQDTIDQALINGVISVGKALTNLQKAFVTQTSGDERAWHQVQGAGYWIDCAIQDFVAPSGVTEYRAVYTLIYSKDDAIRSVEGTHNLI